MKVKRYRIRLLILLTIMIGGLYFLLKRLEKLQLTQSERWNQNVPSEREESIRIPAIRGDIMDRNGNILGTNKPNYELDINLDTVRKFYTDTWVPNLERETLARREGGMLSTRVETDIAAIAETTIVQHLKAFGFNKKLRGRDLRSHYATHRGLVGFNYRNDLSYDEFCTVAENHASLPGAEAVIRPVRNYPYGALAGHILGETDPWSKGSIPDYEKSLYDHYVGDSWGKAGIEKTMDEYLRGVPGKRVISRGPKGVYQGVKEEIPPSSGANVQLTIDAGLQSYIERLLTNIGRGGITVIDVTTGEILALATVPSFNPNDLTGVVSPERFNYYNKNNASPFLNNATQEHQPGSVFKLPVALAAAQAGLMNYNHSCRGYESYGRNQRKVHCWLTSGHGSLGMTSAIQRSCNPYFMALANRLGSKRVVDTFSLLGFGTKSGVQITGEEAGIVPGNLSWRRRNGSMTQSNIANLAIGQQESSASTLQVAAATAAIANKGVFMKPRIIKTVKHPERGLIVDDQPEIKVNLTKEGLSDNSLQTIRHGMWRAANEQGGTARATKFSDTIEVAAKTGTAQTTEDHKKSNNAWTTAFAPYDNPKYAVCAVVIGGTSGGKVAGPLVRETFKALFADSLPEPQITENYRGHKEGLDELLLKSEYAPVSEEEDL